MTPDGLKRMIFGFTKGTSKGLETWTIAFELYTREKKTDEFGDSLVKLDVKVDAKHNKLAEITAAKGMNRSQVKHAITCTALTAETLKKGKTTKQRADKAVEDVLPARTKL